MTKSERQRIDKIETHISALMATLDSRLDRVEAHILGVQTLLAEGPLRRIVLVGKYARTPPVVSWSTTCKVCHHAAEGLNAQRVWSFVLDHEHPELDD